MAYYFLWPHGCGSFFKSEEVCRTGLMVMSSFILTYFILFGHGTFLFLSNMTHTFYGIVVRVGSCLSRLEIHNSKLSRPLESAVALMALPLDVAWSFPLLFSTFFLCSVYSVV